MPRHPASCCSRTAAARRGMPVSQIWPHESIETRLWEVAFGMAIRAYIQAAIDRLVARGVTEIVAVPLLLSSWSPVLTATAYLLAYPICSVR